MEQSMLATTLDAPTLHPAFGPEDKKTHVSKTNDMTAVKLIPGNIESTEETGARASRASIALQERFVCRLKSIPEETKAVIVWDDTYEGNMGCFGTLKAASGEKIAFVKLALSEDKVLKSIQQDPNVTTKKEQQEAQRLVKLAQKNFENEKQFFKTHSTQVPFIVNEISDQILDSYDPIVEYILNKEAAEYPVVLTEHIRQHWIIEELCQMDLFDRTFEKVSIDLIISYTHQLCIMLDFLENNQICHNDLKPANIVCINDQLKLIDFGKWLPIEPLTIHQNDHEDAVGSLIYAAPECLIAFFLREPWKCHKADVWSVGIIVLFLLGDANVISDKDFEQFQSTLDWHPHEQRPKRICTYLAKQVDSFREKLVDQITIQKTDLIQQDERANEVEIKNLNTQLRLLTFTKGLLKVEIDKRHSGQSALVDFKFNFIDKPIQKPLVA